MTDHELSINQSYQRAYWEYLQALLDRHTLTGGTLDWKAEIRSLHKEFDRSLQSLGL